MISKVDEIKMHYIRWVLVIAWLVLIASLFYDPISYHLSAPDNLLSPFRDRMITLAEEPTQCVKVQGLCLPEKPYPLGNRIFWGMVVPTAIAIVFVLGHETWRRICPLYFFSQMPRALGLKPKLQINKNQWLQRNHYYVQFALLFIGLNFRILFINSNRIVFGSFLLMTIFSAVTVVWLYGGRSWCHYFCPFGMVQTVFTGPRGLLDSQAHQAPPRSITQSMCRTVDSHSGNEISACINCKSPCLDIDSEKAYWSHLHQPGRKLVQYGYLGLVSGYFVYYYFYAGNFQYYFSGAWTHEENQLVTLFQPGFYVLNRPIPIPKLVAVPLTLGLFVMISCLLCRYLEKALFSYLKQRNPQLDRQQALHCFFSLCTFIAFNIFFIYGGRPEILRLPWQMQWIFNALIVIVSTLWLYRTWNRSWELYTQESLVHKLRRQLKKLSIDWSEFFESNSLNQLQPNELYILAKVLPGVTQQERLAVYQGVLLSALEEERFTAAESKSALAQLRQRLNLSDTEHERMLNQVIANNPQLYNNLNARKHLKHSRKGLIQLGDEQSSNPPHYSQELPTQISSRKRFSPQENSFSPTIEIKDEN